MVFLRLAVKVYPREKTQSSSSSFSFRSTLGNRDRGRDGSSQSSSGPLAGKPVSFLLVLENPEDVTLGGLAGMIREKWGKLRPNAEPLEIKKLLDDEHDSDDLDAQLTVADVFVDKGKARSEGADQRGTVRVIQKPAPYEPVRFPSVTQDWDAAAEDFERQIQIKKEAVLASIRRFPTIVEEPASTFSPASSFSERVTSGEQLNGNREASGAPAVEDPQRRRDMPLSSVENEEIPMSPPRWGRESSVLEEDSQDPQASTVTATPQRKRMESQELGDSPSPSQTPTPKAQPKPQTSSAKRGSAKKVSANRSISQFVTEPDFPPSNQERASGLESPSGLGQGLSQETESDEEANDRDRDGDVTMNDSDAGMEPIRVVGALNPQKTVPSTPAADIPASQHRKRKKSPEAVEPNKEPRLDQGAGSGSDKENDPSQRVSEPRAGSPSPMRRKERAPSFSEIGRRPSLSEKPVEFSKPGLGLGITKSPPGKQPVMLPLSQESTASIATRLFPSSAPTIRQGSLEDNATPSKQTPALDRVRQLHSALRKDSPSDKSSLRRSVSFAEGEDLVTTAFTPIPKSTPQNAKDGKGAAGSGKKSSTPSKMVFPDTVPEERVEQLMREANQKLEKDHNDREDLDVKIKTAKEQGKNPAYLRLLEDLLNKTERVKKLEKRNRSNEKERLDRVRAEMRAKQEEVAKFEAAMNAPPEPKPNGTVNTPTITPTPKVNAVPVKETKTSTPSVHRNSAKKVVEPAATPTVAKPVTPTLAKAATPIPAKTAIPIPAKTPTPIPAPKTHTPEEEPESTQTEPLQSSSEDAKLPPVSKIHRTELPKTNGASTNQASKKPSPPEPVEVTSSEEEEDEDEDEDEEESSDDTESESESDAENKADKPAKSKAELLRRGSATPSQSIDTRSPAPSQPAASQSQSQSWGQPINAARSRATLKSLLVDKKKEQEVKAQQAKRSIAAPKRPRDIFSPPSDDDSEDESESESESESSSDSDGNSSADDGDIMSSGRVGKLRPARRK